MQDYNYLHGNCMEVTFELSCCKYPPATELRKEWDMNRESLLAYMEKVNPPLNTKLTMMSPLQNGVLCLFYVFIQCLCMFFTSLRSSWCLQYGCLSGPYGCSGLREGGRQWSCTHQCQHCGGRYSPQPDHGKPWGILPSPSSWDIQHHRCGSGVNIINRSPFPISYCKKKTT